MKTATCGLFLILLTNVCHCQNKYRCSLQSGQPDKYFPDITEGTITGEFQMEVDFTKSSKNMSDYYIQYYDMTEKKGRLDVIDNGYEGKYYYYSESMEVFEIVESSLKCMKHNKSIISRFDQLGMTEWIYDDGKEIIYGPYAMFKTAYEMDKKDHSQVLYMGQSAVDVRGIAAEYWRRCYGENLTVDYFFSIGSREGLYGRKNLTSIPLRIDMYGFDDQSTRPYPQIYEIMSYKPFLDDTRYTFELPAGMGCGRNPQEDDNKIPNLEQNNLFISAEAVYTDYSTGVPSTYISDFTYAFDIETGYLSYFYTPWVMENGKLVAGFPSYVVYDSKNKYVFTTSFTDGKCEIGSVSEYIPKYSLPGGNNGYILLTDNSMFYPLSNFHYLGEGVDRGYKVDMFEFATDGFLLGDRLVSNTVVTHYYLKYDEYKQGPRAVQEALTRIRMSFNGTDEKGKKMNAVLNFNVYDYSTGFSQKAKTFYIAQCARDDDDVMFITVGFTAEQAELDLIKNDLPSAVENARTWLWEIIDVPPARLPQVMVDFREALYVTFYLLERAPVQLDFEEPKPNYYISDAIETKGVTPLLDCAYLCLENDKNCTSFAHCGATCYIGGDEKKHTLKQQTDCQYYKRTNYNTVPRLKVIQRNIQEAVESGSPVLTVAKEGGGVIDFKPSYIEDTVFGESEELFDLMGMETNPRLTVVKISSKLAPGTGKNFGKLTYGECQRLCLDFKACETVSYCLSSGECILSLKHAEDMDDSQFKKDNFCNVLTRKYADAYTRSPGNVLSQSAKKTLDLQKEEDCAKACSKETSFDCLSFDHCRTSDGKKGCRLHAVHILDLTSTENPVKQEIICGHYSRKYTYDFKRQSNKKALGNGVLIANGITVEQCAKYCIEYNNGPCNGFDSCQEGGIQVSCTLLTEKVIDMKTASSPICDHYEISKPRSYSRVMDPKSITKGVAGGVGFLVFVIACVVGVVIVYGVAYCRVNRRQ